MPNLELENRVKEIIEQLRPYLQADGGDIKFIELTEDKIVKVVLNGACGSCPYSLMTLKEGIEQAIKQVLPEIVSVERV